MDFDGGLRMNKIVSAWLAVLALITTQAAADVNVVVPGKAAGYLYLPGGGGDDGVSLAVFKEAMDGKPLFQNYRIESSPAGLACDENCVETAQKLPAGQVELKIIGKKPVPGVDIPLKGTWSGGCTTDEDSDTCLMNLDALNAQVRVKVDGDLEPGTIIDLPNVGSVMYVGMDTVQGYILVAAHDQLGGSQTLVEHDPARTQDPDIRDENDGRNNMSKLIAEGSNAAQYCQGLSGGNWYLPARNELKKMEGAALTKVPGISHSLWSSTEYSFEYSSGSSEEEWKYETYYLSRSSSSGTGTMKDMKAYRYRIKKGKVDKNDIESRQVLCFRRMPM